jgi:hypothetical protein
VKAKRHGHTIGLVLLALLGGATTGWAQLDQLGFVKHLPPNVIVVVDASVSMLTDGQGNYHDPGTYRAADDPAVATALGVPPGLEYRRIYRALTYENTQSSSSRFIASDIVAVPSDSAGYATFWHTTRLEIAKRGISQAVSENGGSTYRWGLVKLRQASPQWRAGNNCDKPVRVTDNTLLQSVSDSNPCNAGSTGRYGILVPSVTGANHAQTTASSCTSPWPRTRRERSPRSSVTPSAARAA